MNQKSPLKNRADNINDSESLININTNKNGKKSKKLLSKIGKSYTTLTNENVNINMNKRLLNKSYEDLLQTSKGLNTRFDYSKHIKQAKEIEDLKRIYEKWSGEKYNWGKKKKLKDEDFSFNKKINKNRYLLTDEKKPKNLNENNNYKKLFINSKKIGQEIKKIENKKDNNNSLDDKKINENRNGQLLFSKRIKITLKNKKAEEDSNEDKNKKNILKLKENKNLKLEEEKKKKDEIINIKINKEDISETNDESISVKKNMINFDINKKLFDIKRSNQGLNSRNKIKIKLKNINSLNKIIKRKKEDELSNILKKANLLKDLNNVQENLNEKLEFVAEVDKYIQKEIKNDKDDNLITPEKAVYYVDNHILRFLGYFGSELNLRNCKTYIEKNPTKYALREIIFRIIASGLATQKIYKLYLDNEEYKAKFKEDENEWINFLDNIKLLISNKFNILDDDIYFFKSNYTKFEIYLLIYDKKIIGVEELLRKNNLKVVTCNLLNNVILSPNIFETEFCKDQNEWPKKNLMRGGKQYYPPYGWYGIGLRVSKKYGKSLKWLGNENEYGEWAVAYHSVGKDNVFDKIVNIICGNLKDEEGRLYKYEYNVNTNKNKYPFCGEGVCLFPNIEDAVKFSDKTSLGIFNIKFQFVFMSRVNPNKIRSPNGLPTKWILRGNSDEIRPYRLLIKICSV